MKKIFVMLAIVCAFSLTALAQVKIDYSGNWELDVSKSKLPETSRIESMTLNVAQTEKEIKVETNTKRAARPEGETRDGSGGNGGRREARTGGMRGGMGRGGMMGGGNGRMTYTLDGKETTIESESPAGMPASQMTLSAAMEKDGKLKLNSTRKISTPNGDFAFMTKETWELTDNGRTLKITRETENRRGTQTSEMYFTKNDSVSASAPATPIATAATAAADTSQKPKRVSLGVVNGKATRLVMPMYSGEGKATGAVNVVVTIDEAGNVTDAKAVSGNPLLRSASEEAARQSKFPPTVLSGQAVKATGVLVYNFVAK